MPEGPLPPMEEPPGVGGSVSSLVSSVSEAVSYDEGLVTGGFSGDSLADAPALGERGAAAARVGVPLEGDEGKAGAGELAAEEQAAAEGAGRPRGEEGAAKGDTPEATTPAEEAGAEQAPPAAGPNEAQTALPDSQAAAAGATPPGLPALFPPARSARVAPLPPSDGAHAAAQPAERPGVRWRESEGGAYGETELLGKTPSLPPALRLRGSSAAREPAANDSDAMPPESPVSPSADGDSPPPRRSTLTRMQSLSAESERKIKLTKCMTNTDLGMELGGGNSGTPKFSASVRRVHPLGMTLSEPVRVSLTETHTDADGKRMGEDNREFEELDQQQPKAETSTASSTMTRKLTGSPSEREVPPQHPYFMIRPDSSFRAKWDMIQALFLVYLSFVVPYRVGLKVPAEGGFFIFEFIIDAYFWVDIILNFFTGFLDEDGTGRLVMELDVVRRNYLKGWFFLDFVACLPIGMITRIMEGTFLCSFQADCDTSGDQETSDDVQLLKLLRLLRVVRLVKLLRLVRISRLFERYQDDLFKFLPLISIIKLMVVLLYLGHLFGCFFYFFSSWEFLSPSEQNAMKNGDLVTWQVKEFGSADPDVQARTGVKTLDKYIASMYWAFTTMTTVGYGDIFATTIPERFFAIIGMIAGGFVFSGIIGTMSEVMKNTNLSRRAHSDKMEEVLAFLRDEMLPRRLAKPAISFFRKQDIKGYSATQLLESLPFQLRFLLMKHKFLSAVKHVPFFDRDGDGTLDDPVFFTEMCMCLEPLRYQQKIFVYERGEISNTMYIVIKGAVYLLDKDKHFAIANLTKGSFFGEGAIIGQRRRLENVIAGNCEVAALNRERLQQLLPSYPHIRIILKDTYVHRVQEYMKLGAIDPHDDLLTEMGLAVEERVEENARGVSVIRYNLTRLATSDTEGHYKTMRRIQRKAMMDKIIPDPEDTDVLSAVRDAGRDVEECQNSIDEVKAQTDKLAAKVDELSVSVEQQMRQTREQLSRLEALLTAKNA